MAHGEGAFWEAVKGEQAVGWRIEVWFQGQGRSFKGTVAGYNEERDTHAVQFDERQGKVILANAGEELEVTLDQNPRRTRWLNKQGKSQQNKLLNRFPTGVNTKALAEAKRKEKKLYLPYV